MSMPRSWSRSSTFRRLSGYFTYISTARRITSGDELKQRNGLGDFARDLRFIAAGITEPNRLPHWSDNPHRDQEKLGVGENRKTRPFLTEFLECCAKGLAPRP